jgi:osmotically-inducible protein OsmY
MKCGSTLTLLTAVASALLLVTPPLAFAQPGDAVASNQSLRGGGDSAESTVSRAGEAIRNAYREAATAVSDTAITAEVKAELDGNELTRAGDIQVHTNEGVVTLQGTMKSNEAISAAQKVARGARGVKQVKNEITILPTAIR